LSIASPFIPYLKGCAFWLSYVKEEKNLKVEETEIVIPGGFLLIGN
jgi:hypothetical protein